MKQKDDFKRKRNINERGGNKKDHKKTYIYIYIVPRLFETICHFEQLHYNLCVIQSRRAAPICWRFRARVAAMYTLQSNIDSLDIIGICDGTD